MYSRLNPNLQIHFLVRNWIERVRLGLLGHFLNYFTLKIILKQFWNMYFYFWPEKKVYINRFLWFMKLYWKILISPIKTLKMDVLHCSEKVNNLIYRLWSEPSSVIYFEPKKYIKEFLLSIKKKIGFLKNYFINFIVE